MGNENNIINCDNVNAKQIYVKDGDFKFIKNYDPVEGVLRIFFKGDNLDFEKKVGNKVSWFLDKGTNKVYAFMRDANENVVAAAEVEYHGNNSVWKGVRQKDLDNNETPANEFQGNDIQKEKIKSFIVNKINGSKEEFKLVSNNVLSEAKQAVAATGIQPGGNYKITGNGVEGGQNQIS